MDSEVTSFAAYYLTHRPKIKLKKGTEKRKDEQGRGQFLKADILKALKALSNHFITLEKKKVSHRVSQQQEISDNTEQEMESASPWSATGPQDVRSEVFKLLLWIAAQDKAQIELPGYMTSCPAFISKHTRRS